MLKRDGIISIRIIKNMAHLNDKMISVRVATLLLLYVGMVILTALVTPALADNSYIKLYTQITGQSSPSDAPIVLTGNNQPVTFSVNTDYSYPDYTVEIFVDPDPATLQGGTFIGGCIDLRQPCNDIGDKNSDSTHIYVARVMSFGSQVYATSNKVTITWVAATPGTITGTVTDASGAAIAGASVTADSATTTTDATGSYSISIAPGTYTVTASATGYQDGTASGIIVSSRQTVTQNFVLIPTSTNGPTNESTIGSAAGTITGTVTDYYTKAAIPGVIVTAGNKTATTDATGSYSISIAPGIYPMTASATGYQDGTANGVSVTSGQTTYQNFILIPKSATITGTVTDASTGKAISGATVAATSLIKTVTQLTDEKGFYSIPIPPGTYTVTINANGYNSPNPLPVTLNPGQTVTYNFAMAPQTAPWCKVFSGVGYAVAGGLGVAAVKIGLRSPAAAVPFGIGAAVIGAGASILSLADPPDPNFKVIAQPVVPAVPQVSAQSEVTPELAGAWNDFLSNQAQMISVTTAMIISNERAQGAADAGDTSWQTKQKDAAAGYDSQLASLLAAQPALRANIVNAWKSSGTPDITITTDDVRKYQADVAANGLPPSYTDTLTQMGADNTTIETIRENIIAQKPDDLAGSVMGKLTDPALDSSTQDAIQALNTIVTSNMSAPSETISPSTGTVTEVATEIPVQTNTYLPPQPTLGSGQEETPIVTGTQPSTPGFDIAEVILVLVILLIGKIGKQKKR